MKTKHSFPAISLFIIGLIFLMVPKAEALPIEWAVNGNFYDLITTNKTWQQSQVEADSLTYLGLSGHLATITSAEENAFLNSIFNTGLNSEFAWIGGFEPNDDGVWEWATGPESGTQFSNGVVPTPPFNYANWGGIEPNDNKPFEDFAMFNIGTTFASIDPGQWADASPTPSSYDPVVGYLVEYESSKKSTAVPELSSFLLLGTGLLGFAFKRKAA